MSKQKPTIGIILDWEESGTFSSFPYFALRTHYVDAVRLAGGIPLMIPYGDADSAAEYLTKIDGLLVPGGFYAMPSSWYFDAAENSPYKKTPRFEFEEAIITQALELNLPLLCICAGMQVLSGMFGCKLTANVRKYFGDKIEHFDLAQDHDVLISEGSILHKIIGQTTIFTNSHHQEAVVSVTDPVKVSARSLDGCIEAVELPNKKFVLGLQWHPEMQTTNNQQPTTPNPHHLIFQEFVNAANN